jgi:hypothetical protein
MRPGLILARITSEAGDQHWRTQMTVGRHQFLGDEPQTLGGAMSGLPRSPSSLLAWCPARR